MQQLTAGTTPRGIEYPVALNGPFVPGLEPIHYGAVVGFGNKRVAENSMRHTLLDSLLYARRNGEIHVGNPHRQNVLVSRRVPLVGICASALYGFVEIVCHDVIVCGFL